MTQYLYGASIQGIQSFIFQTNKLKEIIGASEIIENISTNYFTEFLKEQNISTGYEKITMAAGNIKFIFDNESDIKKVVKNFPKAVMEKAYGITISQAVVKFEGSLEKTHIDKLEIKLKTARNKVELPLDLSLNIIKNAPRTGKSGVAKDNDNKVIDKATLQKNKKSNGVLLTNKLVENTLDDKFVSDFKYLSNKKNKIAVIHVDGNGLGRILQQMGKKIEENGNSEQLKTAFAKFSTQLDASTIKAAKDAINKVFDAENKLNIKFRPIVLGGDDLTVVCDANKAIEFTEEYLKLFEENTKENLKGLVETYNLDEFKNGLKAAAGIAYCNEKYPFHYAVDLAEALCGEAKKRSDRKNSCLMFHNIQSSFFTSFSDYKDNELTIGNIEFDFGPYYVEKGLGVEKPSIDAFKELYKEFKKENSPISSLRNWLSELYSNKEHAQSTLNRINQMAEEGKYDHESLNEILAKLFDKKMTLKNLLVEKDGKQKTIIYDILQIKSIND